MKVKSIEERYPDLDTRITKICKMLFEDGYDDFARAMWRMSGGSRTRAFKLATKIVKRFGYESISIEDFDDACAEITGGFEVEWRLE
jgi:hypothetical protein